MPKALFPKRIPEPQTMSSLEDSVFAAAAEEKYKQWFLPLAEDAATYAAPAASILEVGCGPGLLAKALAVRLPKASITALDLSAKALAIARKNCAKLPHVRIQKADTHRLPFPAGQFDVVICKDSFHHFKKPAQALAEMRRVLKKGGILYLQDLRRDMPFYLVKQSVPPVTTFQKLQYYSARASYTKEEIGRMIERTKFFSWKVSTRKITSKLKNFCKKRRISLAALKQSYQARYAAIAVK